MKLSPETKHALIVGGTLIVAVVLGIIVFKKYQANSAASQAQGDQANADDLAYIESLALDGGAYAGGGGGAIGSTITIPSAPATQSLADELASIEEAFGFGATTSSTSSSSGSGSTSHPAPQPVGPQPVRSKVSAPPPPPPVSHAVPYQPPIYSVMDEPVGAEGSYVA